MNLIRHRVFVKHFKVRILPKKSLLSRFETRLKMFLENPKNPILQDHQLTGRMRNFRAFGITGDVRVIYKLEGENLYLYDIGTHNQVY
jgi:addiction module RelE/StbE family toxin